MVGMVIITIAVVVNITLMIMITVGRAFPLHFLARLKAEREPTEHLGVVFCFGFLSEVPSWCIMFDGSARASIVRRLSLIHI